MEIMNDLTSKNKNQTKDKAISITLIPRVKQISSFILLQGGIVSLLYNNQILIFIYIHADEKVLYQLLHFLENNY